jgi:hypothetical protein
MEIFNLIKILLIVVFIVDYSGVVLYIKKLIWKLLNGNKIPFKWFELKPFDCSLCMSFWTLIIYCLFNNYGILNSIFIGVIGAYLASFLSDLLNYIFYIYKKIIKY